MQLKMIELLFYLTGNFSEINCQIKISPRDAQLAAGEFALRHRSRAKCVRAHTFLLYRYEENEMDISRQQRAPICEALETFKKKRVVPFDVPGHKRGRGNPELVRLLGAQCVSLDVNSMKPLDNLSNPVSVISEAEDLMAEAFGAAHAFLMVGGTTASVQAMVLSVCKAGDKIILPRNVHKSVINALILCGAIPVYVKPEIHPVIGVALGMEIEAVKETIDSNPDAVAVLVNNPT